MPTPTTPAATLRAAAEVLVDTERYLSALHGAVARHDNLGADLACAGCQLRDRITTALAGAADRATGAQSVQHAPGKAILCPGCRDKGRTVCLADEAQQPEAHPAQHRWAAELHDPLADEWVSGTRYLVRDRAVNALNHGRKVAATWKDGTPTERRLVRETTTYTVEPTGPVSHLPAGTNAEDCPACKGTNPPYPFLCPGPDAATEEPTP